MTRSERLALGESLIRNGVPRGMTLNEALEILERLVIEGTMVDCATLLETSRRLGLTREGLHKKRVRLGMPMRQSGDEKPVPLNWRERLEASGR